MSEVKGAPVRPDRPLSPHLQIYRPQITSVLSILHRITGIALSFGALLLVVWVAAAAQGPDAFESVQSFLGSPLGVLMLMGWCWALLFHLCTGIRHLIWDVGYGFDLPFVARSGWVAVGVSGGLTLLVWIISFVRLP